MQVDLASGAVRAASEQPVSESSVKDAVEEADYELAPPRPTHRVRRACARSMLVGHATEGNVTAEMENGCC